MRRQQEKLLNKFSLIELNVIQYGLIFTSESKISKQNKEKKKRKSERNRNDNSAPVRHQFCRYIVDMKLDSTNDSVLPTTYINFRSHWTPFDSPIFERKPICRTQ